MNTGVSAGSKATLLEVLLLPTKSPQEVQRVGVLKNFQTIPKTTFTVDNNAVAGGGPPSISQLIFGEDRAQLLKRIFYGDDIQVQESNDFVSGIDASISCEAAYTDLSLYPNEVMAGKAGGLAIKMGADAASYGLSIGQIDEAITKLNKLFQKLKMRMEQCPKIHLPI